MTSRHTAALALAVAVSLAAPAVAAAPKKVSGKGVGQVKLGKTHASLKAKGLVGQKTPGCELAGPNAKAARLKAPLQGAVELTRSNPRKVRSITLRKGGAAKGVGIGDPIEAIVEKFPNAKIDTSTEEVFGLTLVSIPRKDGGKFQYGVSTDTDDVELIGVPFIAFCE